MNQPQNTGTQEQQLAEATALNKKLAVLVRKAYSEGFNDCAASLGHNWRASNSSLQCDRLTKHLWRVADE